MSEHPRMLLMTDLPGRSVADCLLSSDPAEATSAVLGLMAALAAIHVSTMDRIAAYEASRQALGPRRRRILRHRPSSLPTLLHSYIHGDPCPDNTAIDEDVRLSDFESGGVGHALLDGSYLEVPFPTCGRYGTIPEPVVRSCEDLYRMTLAGECHPADDDSIWDLNLTAASASWWVAGLDESLAPGFEKDEIWGTASLRQRVLHRTRGSRGSLNGRVP